MQCGMDLGNTIKVKRYSGRRLTYFDLNQSIRCFDLMPTPLEGNSTVDLDVVDFGPLLIVKRKNETTTVEDIDFGAKTIACQIPLGDPIAIGEFISLPGGDRYNPFQPAGGHARWMIPADVWLYQVQMDEAWLKSVLGSQAVKDYEELCKAPSRSAYDTSLFLEASLAIKEVFKWAEQGLDRISQSQLEGLVQNIMAPCIMSDIEEIKSSTRQKILNKALDYIRDHHKAPIRLTSMSSAVSTSVRNLQIVFKDELGISPTQFIQQYRLHRFRNHLASSNSVTEAAYSSGFKHLGRLTEQYSKVFERYPSEDLSLTNMLEINGFGLQFES